MKTWVTTLILGMILAVELMGMEAKPMRLSVWRKGESIGGEEFVAANEAIVDYLGTLRRPTGIFETIRYQCQVKMRAIRPSVMGNNPPASTTTYVWVNTVYEIKDCKEE